MSAAFSASMIVGAFRLPLVIEGMIDESTTRSASTPITRVSGSTTAKGSAGDPILQVQEGWYAVSMWSRTKASIASSLTQSAPGLISRPR